MSALARYFRKRGLPVAGYDRTPSALTDELIREGISVHFEDDVNNIPPEFLALPAEKLLVVLTPAVPADHGELNFLRSKGYAVHKRSEVLGIITRSTFSIAVAGTHGKTTTSSMVAHLLESSGRRPSAFVGGIMANYGTNFLPGEGKLSVVEADEFDRSFLRLSPDISVITSVDPDHLDIYGTADSFAESFRLFAACLKPGGRLIVYEAAAPSFAGRSPVTYGFSPEADVQIKDVRVEEGIFRFSVSGLFRLEDCELHMPGRYNVLNAAAALTASFIYGVPADELKPALASYRGVKRRFEKVAEGRGKVYIDDYAHHPSELEACISAARELYPGKKIFGAFQPHLYTRTRDFAPGFSKALSRLDFLYLLPIYPARELPIPGVASEMLLNEIACPAEIVTRENLPARVKADMQHFDVLLTLGAGDIDREVKHIKSLFES